MSESYGKGVSNFYRLLQQFKSTLIQEAPEDIQLCEFECHKAECAMGDWKKCDRRLRSMREAQKHN